MTPFEHLHDHFCDNATELGDPPNVARLVRIIGDPGHSAAAATYRKYLRGDSVPGVEVLQSYARRWNESGRAPVEVVVEVRSEVGTVADSAPAGLLQGAAAGARAPDARRAAGVRGEAMKPRTVEQLADLTRRVQDHCSERVHTAATSGRIREDQRRYHADHDDLRPFEDVSRVLRWVVSWNRRMGVVDRAFDAAVADMRRA